MGGTFVVGGFVLLLLFIFIGYFFKGAQRDEVKIVSTWESKDRYAYLQRIKFEKSADKKGPYAFSVQGKATVYQGFYTINTSSKILILSSGYEMNAAGYQENNQNLFSYTYAFQEEDLVLTQLDNRGAPTGQPLQFTKMR